MRNRKRIFLWPLLAVLLLAGCHPAAPSTMPADVTTATIQDTVPTGGVTTEAEPVDVVPSDPLPSGSGEPSGGPTGEPGNTTTSTLPQSPQTSVTGGSTAPGGSKYSGTTTKTQGTTTNPTSTPTPPPPTGEVRGVWVSYIELASIFKGKTAATAPAAIDQVMANCAAYGMTDVYWHVRANSDAWYPSSYFPTNSNVAGLINAGFDPLAYAVQSAHRHGLRLHAWVNPYRIGADKSNARCEDYFSYDGKYYYIPTSEKAQQLILNGIRELVNKYDIDGVQYDDYFYPAGAASENTPAAFEKAAYEAYAKSAGAGALTPGGWRRHHVDNLMAATYNIVHTKSGCKFGISPSSDAQKNYAEFYADVKRWLSVKGYADYICPQVYFGFEHQTAAFDKRVNEWLSYPRHSSVALHVGLAVYKTGITTDQYAGTGKAEWANHSDIMARSVAYLRSKNLGMGFYSYTYFNPDTPRSPSYNKAVAAKEIENLLNALKP